MVRLGCWSLQIPHFPEDRIKRGDGDFRPDFTLFQEPVDEDDEMNNRFRRVIQIF